MGLTVVALPYVSKYGFDGETTQSIILSLIGRGMKDTKFLFLKDCTQVQARNVAAKAAVDEGAEWLWFIDSDADFPVDALARLKACNADIACADMWSRSWPSFRTVLRYGEPGPDGRVKASPVPGSPAGIEDVDLCGMHCTLIRVDLLKRMKQPWFVSGEHGEDMAFCVKAKELGATIRCDFGMVSGHWGRCSMKGQDFTRDAKNQTMSIVEQGMMERMGVLNLGA